MVRWLVTDSRWLLYEWNVQEADLGKTKLFEANVSNCIQNTVQLQL